MCGRAKHRFASRSDSRYFRGPGTSQPSLSESSMTLTASEALFEAFCRQRTLTAERIPTASDIHEMRPDFRVRSRARRARWVYVEVKEIQPTRQEAIEIAKVLAGAVGSFSTEPGAKMRSIVRSAAPQLRSMAGPRDPALVVVNEPSGLLGQHIDPYSILTCMRGLDEVPVYIPRDSSERPTFGAVRQGGKRKMTPSANTSISAIAVLFLYGQRATRLDVFHNRFARCPLRQRDLRGHWIRHFAMTPAAAAWRLLSAT